MPKRQHLCNKRWPRSRSHVGRLLVPLTTSKIRPSDMSTHAQAADEWMRNNPGVMKSLAHFAQTAKNAGRTKLGISMLIERVRWYGTVEQRDKDYKINNNHRAYIARELMNRHHELVDFFDVRRAGDE